MKTCDVAIVGGGAAGLACAVSLIESEKQFKITLVEAGERLGKKLSSTGNGQGNISNLDMTAEHFSSGNINLVSRIACTNAYAGSALFDCLFTADEKGRIYPAGRQASALTDCLIRKIDKKAEVILSTKVCDMQKVDNNFLLTLSDGEKLSAKYVVFCVGGKAQKQFKTDGSSYALACKFGHKITPLYPSLVQLKTRTDYIKTLKGIRTDCNVSAYANGKLLKTVRGDVIFTEYGVSGNAIFSVSPYVTDKPDSAVSLEFLPDFNAEVIEDNLTRRKMSGYRISELLSGTLHNQLGRAIIARANSDDVKTIVKTLKNFWLPVLGTLGFDYAQVTRGGIDMNGITDSLESRYCKNLYFAGEVLDVDGDCGGYNLQWAFTSAMAVAKAIISKH